MKSFKKIDDSIIFASIFLMFFIVSIALTEPLVLLLIVYFVLMYFIFWLSSKGVNQKTEKLVLFDNYKTGHAYIFKSGNEGIVLLIFAAAVIKTDRIGFSKETIITEHMLANKFEAEYSDVYNLFDEILKRDYDIKTICETYKTVVTHYQILNNIHMLFKIAAVDGKNTPP